MISSTAVDRDDTGHTVLVVDQSSGTDPNPAPTEQLESSLLSTSVTEPECSREPSIPIEGSNDESLQHEPSLESSTLQSRAATFTSTQTNSSTPTAVAINGKSQSAPMPAVAEPKTQTKASKKYDSQTVATQMAAVAAAATASHSGSPSAAADYARGLRSATIAIMPFSKDEENDSAASGPAILSRKERAVHLNIVRAKLRAAFEQSAAQELGKHDERDDVRWDSVTAPDHEEGTRVCTNYDSAAVAKSTTSQDAKLDMDAIEATKDSRFSDGELPIQDKVAETEAVTDEPSAPTSESNEQGIISTVNLREIPHISCNIEKKHSVMQNQLSMGHNDCFLNYLLLLASIRVVVDCDAEVTTGSSNPVSTLIRPTGGDNILSLSPRIQRNTTDDVMLTEEDKTAAQQAAMDVADVLGKAERAYETLSKLLPPAFLGHLQPSQITHLTENNSSTDNNDENYEDTADYETTPVIPDLLPPCTSLSGDATAAFFRACAATSEANANGAVGPPPFSPATGNSNKISPLTSSPASAPSPPLASSTPTLASSIVSSVISSVKSKNSSASLSINSSGNTLGGVFGKVRSRAKKPTGTSTPDDASTAPSTVATAVSSTHPSRDEDSSTEIASESHDDESPTTGGTVGAEYTVQINREMLGLTVENVLERTVVRTVLPGGAAKKAGAKVGSLIVKVGSVETSNLTHFETIDELRQSQRPLKLVLRRISKDALRGAREEMGRLIRGGGFGIGAPDSGGKPLDGHSWRSDKKENINDDDFAKLVHEQWIQGTERLTESSSLTGKDEALCKAGEKLVWILSLLVIGLEREAFKRREFEGDTDDSDALSASSGLSSPQKGQHKHLHHTSKDYADAAKSISKVLQDYTQNHLEGEARIPTSASSGDNDGLLQGLTGVSSKKRSKQVLPPPHILAKQKNQTVNVPGVSKRTGQFGGKGSNSIALPSESALLKIGDVLHRTRTFLGDPASPPAALVRGEVIALLCDVLDIDADMSLSDEETASSVAGHKAGPINDLGSAGSLLKLVVLNCLMMRSPGCAATIKRNARRSDGITHYEDSHKLHAGNRFLAVVHRLAASNSTSARVTACSLGPVLWSHLDFPHQLQLRGVITRALHDVEVIVRKSTATVLHEIAELVFDSRAVPWLVLMCERAMTDPEPQLRAAAMTLTWHLAEHLPNAFLGDASKGSRSIRRLPPRTDPTFAEVYLLQCKILPVATRLAEDRAPSVRLAVAAQCDRLANALGEHWYSVIIDLLQALLGDADDRVRSESSLCVPRLVESVLLGSSIETPSKMGVSVLDSLLPVALKLLKDPSSSVRVSLATAAGELLTLLVGLFNMDEISAATEGTTDTDGSVGFKRHKRHIDDTLIPLVQKLLHDTDPEVTSAALRAVTNASRGNVREIGANKRNYQREVSTLEDDTTSISSHHSHVSMERKEPVFIPVLSEKQVLRLLPTLSDLATSPQWRVRQSAVEIVPALLGCTHRLETRSEIAQLCVKLMGDNVDAVRRTAAECLCLGGGSLGRHGNNDDGEWMGAIVIPHLQSCRDNSSPKQRLLSLKMVEVVLLNGVCPVGKGSLSSIFTSSSADGTEASSSLNSSSLRSILEVAGSLADDKIVNVRLNVGRVFGSVVSTLGESELLYAVEVLEGQILSESNRPNGGDRDVIYFAKRALGWAQDRLEESSLWSA